MRAGEAARTSTSGVAVQCRMLAQRSISVLCMLELRGLAVVVGDDVAELAPAADFSHGLRPEAGVEHVVADLFALTRSLLVVVSQPQRQVAVELLGREADEVVEALVLECADEALGVGVRHRSPGRRAQAAHLRDIDSGSLAELFLCSKCGRSLETEQGRDK